MRCDQTKWDAEARVGLAGGQTVAIAYEVDGSPGGGAELVPEREPAPATTRIAVRRPSAAGDVPWDARLLVDGHELLNYRFPAGVMGFDAVATPSAVYELEVSLLGSSTFVRAGCVLGKTLGIERDGEHIVAQAVCESEHDLVVRRCRATATAAEGELTFVAYEDCELE